MNKRVKKLWVEALRSGKYKQAQCHLRIDNGFCCLGVLCDLHRKETRGRWDAGRTENSPKKYLGEADFLPTQVAQWAGLGRATKVTVGKYTLPQYNDGDSAPLKTFAELADIIERRL